MQALMATYRQVRQLTSTEASYVAGVVDGEGTMFLLLPVFWLLLWIGLGVVISAALGVPPGAEAVECSALVFFCGGILLPGISLFAYRMMTKWRLRDAPR
jgi:hypothetical protein